MKVPESVHDTPCSRSCGCWTPYQTCVNGYKCSHHEASYEAALDRLHAPTVRYATETVPA